MAKQIIHTDKAPAPLGPYNQAVLANGTLYCSGQVPIDPATGKVVEGDIQAQARQVMANLQAVLQAAGMDFGHVVKCSIFVQNMDDFAAINEVYGSYFDHATAPARETVEVARLPIVKGSPRVNLEISCIAVG